MKILKCKHIYIIVFLLAIIILVIGLLDYKSAPKYYSSIDQFGNWSLSTQQSLNEHNYILPEKTQIQDIEEYVLIEYPETMKLPMYYISCHLNQTGDVFQWKSFCETRSYIKMDNKNDDRVIFCSEETLNSIKELMNDDIFDGKTLFFSFVEIRKSEQDIVFIVAEIEDGLDTSISSFDHYLLSLICV